MANHFTALGFEVRSDDDLAEVVRVAGREGRVTRTRGGRIVEWSLGGAGIVLWVDHHGNIGVQPHFEGETAMRVRLDRWYADARRPLLAARAHGRAASEEDGAAYAYAFDVVAAGHYRHVGMPCETHVQVAAFAEWMEAFADEAAFAAAQEGERTFAAESFVPASADEASSEADPPPPHALVSGRVLSVERLRNELSGLHYLHLVVRTWGGELDVVADPETVKGEPVVGGIVHGWFWLSGRLPDSLRRRVSPLGRFFGRTSRLFWPLAPTILFFAWAINTPVRAWRSEGGAIVLGLDAMSVLALLVLFDPKRFAWAGRALAGLIFITYSIYLAMAWGGLGGTLRYYAPIGYVVYGVSALYYVINGRFPWKRRHLLDD